MQQKGFQLEHCRSNCPKTTRNWRDLYETLSSELTDLNLLKTLEDKFCRVLHHHQPRISISGCPNGCSQPNIKDFGITGYRIPRITDAPCSGCKACVQSCIEMAITWQPNKIIIDNNRCLSCGDCQNVCPSGTLTAGESGWTLHFGGRVGRHPKFAEYGGQVSNDKLVVEWIIEAILLYIENGQTQERLTHFLEQNKSNLMLNVIEQHVHESSSVNIRDSGQ